MTYAEWIEAYVSSIDGRHVLGKCGHATAAMKLEFPELRLACGFAHCVWGARQHWWCVTPDGKIVDPTVEQFPGGVVLEYEELDPERDQDRIPTGVCYWCGDDTFRGEGVCSQACNDAAFADLNGARP